MLSDHTKIILDWSPWTTSKAEWGRGLVDNMPFELDATMWGAVLNAFRIHEIIDVGKHAKYAKHAMTKLLELEPPCSLILYLSVWWVELKKLDLILFFSPSSMSRGRRKESLICDSKEAIRLQEGVIEMAGEMYGNNPPTTVLSINVWYYCYKLSKERNHLKRKMMLNLCLIFS